MANMKNQLSNKPIMRKWCSERSVGLREKCVLVSLPEISTMPNLILPPLSLQMLRHSLSRLGIPVECHDFSPYGLSIAKKLDSASFWKLFLADHETSRADTVQEWELPLECLAAVGESGLEERFQEILLNAAPILLGLSIPGAPMSSDLFTVALCKHLSRLAKNLRPELPIVIGGARTLSKQIIREKLLGEPSITYLVQGKGSRSICMLASGILNGTLEPGKVPGLVYRLHGRTYITNGDPPVGHLVTPVWFDSEALPYYQRPVADLSPQIRHVPLIKRYLHNEICTAPLQFTIGCRNHCAFCMRAEVRGRSSRPSRVIDIIEEAVKEYGVKEFIFLNSEINFTPDYVKEFAGEMIRRKLDILWTDSCGFSGLTVESLKMLYDAGCVALWFGAESASQRLLHYIKKPIKLEEATRMLYESNRLGIHNCLNIICGLPYETEEDIQSTLSYIVQHHEIIDAIQVNVFYLKGGPFFSRPSKFGLMLRGYQEQVGPTFSYAFEELNGGLGWEDKKRQMLASYACVKSLVSEFFLDESSNMSLILALYRLLGRNKKLIQEVLLNMSNPMVGNFIESQTKLIRHAEGNYILEPSNQTILEVDDCVASCHDLRHVKIWSHIEQAVRDKFDETSALSAMDSIRCYETQGYFRKIKSK